MRISLVSTGGTISTGRVGEGMRPVHGAAELFRDSGPLPVEDVEVRPVDFGLLSSRAVTPQDMYRIADTVRAEIGNGAAGVVVTHGTDTMEETAYALSMLVEPTVPVVLTGAMRSQELAGSDAGANLSAAIVAASTCPSLARYGPVVVHQDELHAPRWLTKLHSTRVAAFASPSCGPIGIVSEGRVVLFHGPAESEVLDRRARPSKRVELIWAVSGSDGLVMDSVGDQVDGFVVAGTGGGHAAPPLAEAMIRQVERGTPVVMSSRCPSGQTLHGTYGGPGSEIELAAAGVVMAGNLSPVKARLRLIFGLSAGLSATELFQRPPDYGRHPGPLGER